MGLAFHSIERVGPTTLLTTLEQRRRSFDVERYRQRHADLARRREEELRLLERQLGRLPVSETLPNTEPEVAAFHPELVRRLAALPTRTFHSLESLVQRHRDPSDGFSFAEFDFIHAPGGHAPMVDFRDNPWLGEALHLAREHGVLLISLICHAPVALTSTWQRVDEALKEAGFTVRTGLNPSGVKVVYEPALRLLTDNGPQAIDARPDSSAGSSRGAPP